MSSILEETYLVVKLLHYTVVLFFSLSRSLNNVFHNDCTITFLETAYKSSPFLHPYQYLFFVCFLIITILTEVSWYLIMVLISVSSMINDVEHFFIYLLAIYLSYLDINSLFDEVCKYFLPFYRLPFHSLDWVICFLIWCNLIY